MSYEVFGGGDEEDYSHLTDAGWWDGDQVREVLDAINALTAENVYESNKKENGISVRFLQRLTQLRQAAGLDVHPTAAEEAKAAFECDCGAATEGKWAHKHSPGCRSLPRC